MTWSKFSTVCSALISVSFLAMHEVWAAMIIGGVFLFELRRWINHPTADVKWLFLLQVAGLVLIIYGTYLGFASGRL